MAARRVVSATGNCDFPTSSIMLQHIIIYLAKLFPSVRTTDIIYDNVRNGRIIAYYCVLNQHDTHETAITFSYTSSQLLVCQKIITVISPYKLIWSL